MTKYIFVTGGVVSGLGKGITAASLGRLLKSRGLKIAAQKLDPYINVDPGTMSPFQHGEVYVTDDGAETDLDLGHYERFIDEDLNKFSNLTTGKVYWNVLNKERAGEYLGETVQVIPHITNEIKSFIYSVGKKTSADVVITEIGGTTGDIESQPFLEAIRQVAAEVGRRNCLFIHVTLVPFISGSNEPKSKPTQHSVKELRGLGISPDIIVARVDQPMDDEIKRKISMFCTVPEDCVIENRTLPVLYQAPMMLEESHLSDIVCRELSIGAGKGDMSEWQEMLERIAARKNHVKIALVGKYVKLHDAYLSVAEALQHGGYETGCFVDIDWVDSEEINDSTVDKLLGEVDGIILPGGFGARGVEGMICAANYARTQGIPYFGICLGMQIAVMSYARNVLGYADANSSEFDQDSTHPVIDLMESQQGISKKGGTMRLGAYPCKIRPFFRKLLHSFSLLLPALLGVFVGFQHKCLAGTDCTGTGCGTDRSSRISTCRSRSRQRRTYAGCVTVCDLVKIVQQVIGFQTVNPVLDNPIIPIHIAIVDGAVVLLLFKVGDGLLSEVLLLRVGCVLVLARQAFQRARLRDLVHLLVGRFRIGFFIINIIIIDRLQEPAHNACHLGTGGLAARIKAVAAVAVRLAADNARVLHRLHRRTRIGRNAAAVAEGDRRAAVLKRCACGVQVAVQDGDKLLARYVRLRREAAAAGAGDDAVLRRPRNRIAVPAAARYIGEVCAALRFAAVQTAQHRHEHRAGHSRTRRKLVIAGAVEQTEVYRLVNVLLRPVGRGYIAEVGGLRLRSERQQRQTHGDAEQQAEYPFFHVDLSLPVD